MNGNRSERGQAIVLIVIAIVALIGFAALAVDGGQVYAERRRAQNAADAAALAAAFKGADGGTQSQAIADGIAKALKNGFNNDGVTNTVTIENPPTSGPYAGSHIFYRVIIHSEVKLNIAQVVYQGPLEITVEAVARGNAAEAISAGTAWHATAKNGIGIEFTGDAKVNINGGDMFSNSNSAGSITKKGGAGSIVVTNGKIFAAGTYVGKTGTNSKGEWEIYPNPVPGQTQRTIPPLPRPDCDTGLSDRSASGGGTLQPGRYTAGIKNGDYTLKPGIYCIWNGIDLTGNGSIVGEDVFLALMDDAGIKLKGNSKFVVNRPNYLVDGSGNSWGGMLMWVNPEYSGTVIGIGGNNDSDFSGTIYNPNGICDLGGTGNANGIHASVVCQTIKTHGTTDIKIVYKEAENYRMRPMVEVVQ